MSESYVTTETTVSLRVGPIKDQPQTAARFTPLRSAIVVRKYSAKSKAIETLTPLVPIRRVED